MAATRKKFMIVDGHALIHRAFHALPPLATKEGLLVNAVYGFTMILLKALKDLKPEYAAVAFDLPAPTFRHKLYKEYKATRIKKPQELYDQIPLIVEIVHALNIPLIAHAGMEADDIIATLAHDSMTTGQQDSIENIIVTGDMDTLQLVDGNTKVYGLRKGMSDIVVYDEKAVTERYGITPAQMIDYKALRGDPSDNIPGVKGIGEKTATELLQKFGTIEKIYKTIEDKKTGKDCGIKEKTVALLLAQKEGAMLGKKLVTLVRDVPLEIDLEGCKRTLPDKEKLTALFQRFEFRNLMERVEELQNGGEKKVPAKVQGALLGGSDGVARSVGELPPTGGASHYMVTEGGTWGHDLKLLVREGKLAKEKLGVSLFDTMIAAYLLHPGARVYDFDNVVREYEPESPDLKHLVPILKQKLEHEGLWQVFSDIEMPLIPVLSAMETAGIKVDVAQLKGLSKEFTKELERLTKEIYKHAGEEFNINSPLQLREILFVKMKLAPATGRIKKTTKGGVASTAAGQLEKLRGLHPIVDAIFEHRELSKLRSTYTDALQELVEKDGRVHTTFNQTGAATGRLSSSNPNLQNIPIRSETGRLIRKAFIAEKGNVLLAADYSQIDLRCAASLSGDPEMIKAFNAGEDFHRKTAALVFGVEPNKVTDEMRRNSKAINFGIIYGMGATSLAVATGMPRSDAAQFIERYFEVFNTLYDYLEGLKVHARDKGYVETLFGRKRYLPEITSGVQQVRAAAERMAINMPVQGSTADIAKLAMIRVDEWLQKDTVVAGFQPAHSTIRAKRGMDVRMLLQVHDEIVFEVKKELVDEVAPKIKSIMEKVCELKVPIVVDIKVGENWGEMAKMKA